MISEFNLTPEQEEIVRNRVKELKDQAEFYDMAVDYEANRIIVVTRDTSPQWLKNWRNRDLGDNDPADPEQAYA